MNRYKISRVLVAVMSFLPCAALNSSATESREPADNLESKAVDLRRSQSEEYLRENALHEQVRSISSMFDVFISSETHPHAEAKRNRLIKGELGGIDRYEWFVPSIRVTRQTSLRDVMEEFSASTGRAYLYEELSNQICLIPAESGEKLPSPLDLPVSFTGANLSTETAFAGVVGAFNARHPGHEVVTQTNADMHGMRMPEPYSSDSSIKLELEDVPLRTALCHIMDRSPIRMYYLFKARGQQMHLLILATNYKMPDEMVKSP